MWPNSIVFRTALFSALITGLVCTVTFVTLFRVQTLIYEERLTRDTEEGLEKTTSFLLGFYYAQGNWIHLESQLKKLIETPNTLYTYIVNNQGNIDVGVEGLKSPDIGMSKQTWEPEIPFDLGQSTRVSFVADKMLAEKYSNRISLGDKVVILSAPVYCPMVRQSCAQVRVAVIFESIQETLTHLRMSLLIAGILLTLSTALIVFFVNRRNLMPIRQISQHMRDLAARMPRPSPLKEPEGEASKPLLMPLSKRRPEEMVFFQDSLEKFTAAMENANQLESELNTSRSLSDLAAQVAHDIRSPLTALEMGIGSLSHLSEQNRILFRSAVARIRDIANNLLTRKAEDSQTTKEQGETNYAPESATVQSLHTLVDSVVSEKRTQYRSRIGIDIQTQSEASAYGLFAHVPPSELKRVLSNLINNSVEAIESRGKVTLSISTEGESHLIRIRDTGKGIPDSVIPLLMKKGFSYGKANGSGLGLYYAKIAVESWGGHLSLQSKLMTGTLVTLSIPKSEPPSWFVPRLEVSSRTTIVVLDDDSSIHRIWKRKFEEVFQTNASTHIVDLATPDELLSFHKSAPHDTLYLIDYELLGFATNGLELILSLNIQSQSILVTSRSEESTILERCLTLGVRLIPKGQAAYVPIEVSHLEPSISPIHS